MASTITRKTATSITGARSSRLPARRWWPRASPPASAMRSRVPAGASAGIAEDRAVGRRRTIA